MKIADARALQKGAKLITKDGQRVTFEGFAPDYSPVRSRSWALATRHADGHLRYHLLPKDVEVAPVDPLPIAMSMPERFTAVAAITHILNITREIAQYPPEMVTLAMRLCDELASVDLIGPAKDIPEASLRMVRLFANWQKGVLEVMPAAVEIANRPPLTNDDIQHMGKEE